MDPNANLKEQREISQRIVARSESERGVRHQNPGVTGNTQRDIEQMQDALRLAELMRALDYWIFCGNALPDDWSPRRK